MKHHALQLSSLLAFLILNSAGYAIADTGTLVFLFAGREMQNPVNSRPNSLRFELYSADPPNQFSLLTIEERLYAPTVFLNNVPSGPVFLRVTSFDDFGVPMDQYEAALEMAAGGEVEIDLRGEKSAPWHSRMFSVR